MLRGLADADGTRERGPLLAMVELEKRAREKQLGSEFGWPCPCYYRESADTDVGISESDDGLLTLLKLYIERFGDKACCFEDLKPYVTLQGEELSKIAAYLDSLPLNTVCGFHAAPPFFVLIKP